MPANTSDADLPIVDVGEFRIDFQLRSVYCGSEKVKIGAMAFNTLEFLVRNRHRVVSKAELLKEVWEGQRTKGTVEQAISQLRRVLHDDAAEARYIETVPGHGYRFIAEVRAPVPGESDKALVPQSSGAVGVADLPGGSSRHWPRFRRLSTVVAVGAVILCVAGIAVVWHFRKPVEIATISANGNALVAKGLTGSVLWTYRFDDTLREISPEEANWRTRVVDLNGDGGPEVLFAAAFLHGQDELFCFSSRGKLLWRYRPEIHMEFNTRDLNGPWRIAQMIVVDEGASKSIWIAVDHTLWWPAFIVKISPDGGPETMFTSSGAIRALLSVRTKSGSYVLAGGINNEYRMASVAVLAANGPPATSPQSDGVKYQCIRGCPSGRPYRYILLPRSELNVASDRPYNEVASMETRSGGITTTTTEGPTAQYFDFSEELQPQRVIYSGDYPEVHRRYEIEGRLAHSFELCPERRSPAIVRVFDENGIPSPVSVPRVK